jgi:hypothetical protein
MLTWLLFCMMFVQTYHVASGSNAVRNRGLAVYAVEFTLSIQVKTNPLFIACMLSVFFYIKLKRLSFFKLSSLFFFVYLADRRAAHRARTRLLIGFGPIRLAHNIFYLPLVLGIYFVPILYKNQINIYKN